MEAFFLEYANDLRKDPDFLRHLTCEITCREGLLGGIEFVQEDHADSIVR